MIIVQKIELRTELAKCIAVPFFSKSTEGEEEEEGGGGRVNSNGT